jgi:pimeloyl-ACP methyl ester carboxylesterase/uncharacterized membrane protein HdeD (DUF308 family)
MTRKRKKPVASAVANKTDLSSLRLHVRYDEGSGPIFVLLHGINSDGTDWRPVIDRLGPGFRCLALDLLGFGESPKPLDIDYSADEHAAVLDATLTDLDIRGRFVLVGYSLGGDIAIRYAALHPEKLRRLFLLSTPFYLPPEEYAERKFGREFFWAMAFERLWKAIARQKKKGGAIYELASGKLEDFAKGFLRTDDVSEHWDIMSKNLTNTIAAATFVDDLPHLTMPTVFALGVRDPIVRPDQTPALKRLKPDIEIRRIVGLTADHFILLNIPERVAAEIMRDEVRRLHVAWHGGTGKPVVLLHGIEDAAERWYPLAKAMARGSDVAVLDLLGFGASPVPLSSHYTLEDHAAAVLATVTRLYGANPVTLVGHGFGALVALAYAAAHPSGVSRVVAFSPTLLPPGVNVEDLAEDPQVAELLAARDAAIALASNERSQAIASERLELRFVPAKRSLETVMKTDAETLLDRIQVPVRFVLPTQDRGSARDWLAQQAAGSSDFELLEPHGSRLLPYERPAEALAALGGAGDAQLYSASIARVVPRRGKGRLASAVSSVNGQLIRRGSLMTLGGLAFLLWPGEIPPRLVTTALAVWLLVEAIQTIAGAFGLRRGGKSWLPWLLIGGVSVVFAAFLTVNDAFALWVTGFAIAAWALGRGLADLFVAWRAPETPGRRWALVLEGMLGIAIAVAIIVEPELGGRLLRWTLGGYMTVSGVITLGLAWSVHRRTRARICAYLTEE